ncbi:MAG: hypothetical protein IID16_11020 [Candidatus Marinimicrobia bacterium]|nr:hypothetical protein [Candidatus Neomarinimicrobiota bacterium]
MEEKKNHKIIYAAFCGTGKSYLCNNFSDTYREIECWQYRNGENFPYNYIQEVVNSIGKTKYLFISTDPIILKGLNKLSIEIKLIYPKNELRNEYLDSYLTRDDPYDFIGTIMKKWNIWLDELKDQNYCTHAILEKGQYLQDVIEH